MSESNLKGFIGTYTKGDSKGIYTFTLNSVKGKIEEVRLAAELENPTYLAISEDSRYLYSVVKAGDSGGAAAFAISETGELRELNQQLAPGAAPCHVSVNRNRSYLFSVNYHKGEVVSHQLDSNGAIQPAASVIKHVGRGPDPRQDKPHTHYAGLTPDQQYLAVVELGIDALITYKVNDNAVLTKEKLLPLKAGSGPRHLVFHPSGKFAYIMTEFSSEVIVLDYNEETGRFTEKQYISTLPDNFQENNQGSAIHISSDGRFVYAGNRGHNSIALFSVNQDSGELQFIEHTSTEGNWPRDFALDPSERFILASNQESGNLVLFARDQGTGKLTLLQSDIYVPYPVCVKFLHG
ncbi:lactonase family protein [Bacillus rubiinfantis]|uniref:lactonase family protein n=1 Tax=Bacillus rubiinfantis TaxID=1499680 RepID=UPI0005A68A38|nr:lactonase family protein [Bacillus rubiinfantis]